MIALKDVSKSFDRGQTWAVRGISLEVADGETLVLLGSSGSGKTTTLKMINRLLEPTEGAIEIDGEDVRAGDPVALRRRIGYVFQGIGLFPHMTVEANVAIVPRLLGWPRARRRARAAELLELVGLPPAEYGSRHPNQLSGGQQQRVAVARALAADPEYLLMDEPFGALDALTRDALQQELVALKRRLEKTVVFVTHDIFEALAVADRLAVFHEGHVEQIGRTDEVLRGPATSFVRSLFAKPAEQLAAFREAL
ncbi:MAG: ATP-binding cassette domain-containing protein [Planctomycetes bacterium]|nr:ATP-binding cassette domain-containing protein [Planctomycetota bacterium]